jgi:hypothetical protein
MLVSRQLRVAVRAGNDAVVEDVNEYLSLADRLGFECADVDAIRLRHLLAAHGITLHDRARVKAALDQECGGEFAAPSPLGTDDPLPAWGWRPLRRRDIGSREGRAHGLSPRSGEILASRVTYDKALPLGVLRTAVRVHEQFPEARFFVSDVVRWTERALLDGCDSPHDRSLNEPYLAVQLTARGDLFVVDSWQA